MSKEMTMLIAIATFFLIIGGYLAVRFDHIDTKLDAICEQVECIAPEAK